MSYVEQKKASLVHHADSASKLLRPRQAVSLREGRGQGTQPRYNRPAPGQGLPAAYERRQENMLLLGPLRASSRTTTPTPRALPLEPFSTGNLQARRSSVSTEEETEEEEVVKGTGGEGTIVRRARAGRE
jgi:hypothetical protein